MAHLLLTQSPRVITYVRSCLLNFIISHEVMSFTMPPLLVKITKFSNEIQHTSKWTIYKMHTRDITCDMEHILAQLTLFYVNTTPTIWFQNLHGMNRCALFNTLHLTPTIHNLLNKGTLICRVGSMCKYLFPSCHYMFAPLCEWGENVWLYGDVRHKGVGWGWGGGVSWFKPKLQARFPWPWDSATLVDISHTSPFHNPCRHSDPTCYTGPHCPKLACPLLPKLFVFFSSPLVIMSSHLELIFRYIWINHLSKVNKGCTLVGEKHP